MASAFDVKTSLSSLRLVRIGWDLGVYIRFLEGEEKWTEVDKSEMKDVIGG